MLRYAPSIRFYEATRSLLSTNGGRVYIPPVRAKLFPREGGDPDWAFAFAGEQDARGARDCQIALTTLPSPLDNPLTTTTSEA